MCSACSVILPASQSCWALQPNVHGLLIQNKVIIPVNVGDHDVVY